MDKPKKSIDILTILGGKPTEESDDDMDPSELSLKAAFKAIKANDFEGFRDSLNEWMTQCKADSDDTEDYELDD